MRNRTRSEVASKKKHGFNDCAGGEERLEQHLMKDFAKAKVSRSGLHELLKAGARLLHESQGFGRGSKQSLRNRAVNQAPDLLVAVYDFDRTRVLLAAGLALAQNFCSRGQALLL